MSEVYLCPICDYKGITKNIIRHFKSTHQEYVREVPYINTRSMSCKALDIYLILAFDSCFVVRSGYSVYTRKFTDNVQMLESNEELLSNYKYSLEVQSKNGIIKRQKFVQPYNFSDLTDENSITINSDVILRTLDAIDNLKFVLDIIELKKIERTILLEDSPSSNENATETNVLPSLNDYENSVSPLVSSFGSRRSRISRIISNRSNSSNKSSISSNSNENENPSPSVSSSGFRGYGNHKRRINSNVHFATTPKTPNEELFSRLHVSSSIDKSSVSGRSRPFRTTASGFIIRDRSSSNSANFTNNFTAQNEELTSRSRLNVPSSNHNENRVFPTPSWRSSRLRESSNSRPSGLKRRYCHIPPSFSSENFSNSIISTVGRNSSNENLTRNYTTQNEDLPIRSPDESEDSSSVSWRSRQVGYLPTRGTRPWGPGRNNWRKN